MAIIPGAEYPGQIDASDTDYPLGKAQNESLPGSRTGTPFEERWLNDLFGWQQALLRESGIDASGVPDHANLSDYLAAMQAIMDQRFVVNAEGIHAILRAEAPATPIPTREIPIPMSAFQVLGDPAHIGRLNSEIAGGDTVAVGSRIANIGGGTIDALLPLNRRVPHGAAIMGVQLAVYYFGRDTPADVLTVSLDTYQSDFDNWGGVDGPTLHDASQTIAQLGYVADVGRHLVTTGLLFLPMLADRGMTLRINFSGGDFRVHGCRLYFSDSGPRNF